MQTESQPPISIPVSEIVQNVEKKYGAKDWEEFDRLEQQNRILPSSNQSMEEDVKAPKKKKLTRKQKKESQIRQYEHALKMLRTKGQQFHNPFQRQKLTLEYMPVLKMLERAFSHEYDLQAVLKKMGLKTAKILFKCGARINIWFMLTYLKDGTIPRWIIERHREMMKKREEDFNSDQNTLLRTMSSNNNTCI